MICKWCGAKVDPVKKRCGRCGREVPALSDCGGFYDLVPDAPKEPVPVSVPASPAAPVAPVSRGVPTGAKVAIGILAAAVVALGALLILRPGKPEAPTPPAPPTEQTEVPATPDEPETTEPVTETTPIRKPSAEDAIWDRLNYESTASRAAAEQLEAIRGLRREPPERTDTRSLARELKDRWEAVRDAFDGLPLEALKESSMETAVPDEADQAETVE